MRTSVTGSVTPSTPTVNAGRLVLADPTSLDPQADYWANDVGINGGAASAEEAAIHVVIDDDERS